MSVALISTSELIQAATGVDWASVAESGDFDDPVQAVEQTQVIRRATWWAANYCGMPQGLHATEQTEMGRTGSSASIGDQVWVDKYGILNFKAQTTPVLSVTSSQWARQRGTPSWQSIDPTTWQITGPFPMTRHLTNAWNDWRGLRAYPALVEVTYVSGWANAVLTADAADGAGVNLAVDTTFGMSEGQILTVYDGAASEDVEVAAVVDGETVTVTSLVNPHEMGVGVSAIPSDIKEAAILASVHFVRQRGELVVGITGSGGAVTDTSLTEAQDLLQPYRVLV